MIRILHVLGGLERGGAETMIMNLYRKIDRSQIQFDFIIHTTDKQSYYDEIINMGGKIYSFPKFKVVNFHKQKKIWKEFFKNHPEYKILHSHVRSYASLYFPIARKAGIKTIIHSHSISNGKGLKSFVKKIMQFPLRFCSDYFFACSEMAGKWLFGKTILKNKNFHIIKNAIDIHSYKFDPKKRDSMRKLLGVEDKKVYMHVGRFHPAKNHMFLLELFADIKKESLNSVLVLVGDGDLRSQIENKILELGIKNDVILTGSRNDVPDLLQAADCFLFTSIWEGLGMGAIEAEASGLKTICSTGIPLDVKLTENCYFIALKDKQDWVREAVNLKYERDSNQDKVIAAGYDINVSARELSNFYKEIWNA